MNIPYTFQHLETLNALVQCFLNSTSTHLNKIVSVCVFVSITCLSTFNATAQVTLIAGDNTANKGETIDVPLQVKGFNDIFSLLFTISWDTTVLAFKEVHSFSEALPQFTIDGIGIGNITEGRLIVLWLDNSLTGVNVADSTEIIVLRFEVIGEEGSKSAIAFTNDVEVIDATPAVLDVEVINGEIAVLGNTTATTFLQAQNGMRLFQNHPNPFYKNTTIKASFTTAEWVILTIRDTYGRSVYVERFKAVNGINNILINTEQLSVGGTYTYTLSSSTHQLSKQMIVVPQ